MTRSLRLPLSLLAVLLTPAIPLAADPPGKPSVVSVTRIWDKAPHCAFTDLLRWKNRWLCCFREASGHGGDDGVVRLITSSDGSAWKSLAVLKQAGIDLRDPKLSLHPDPRGSRRPGFPQRADGSTRPGPRGPHPNELRSLKEGPGFRPRAGPPRCPDRGRIPGPEPQSLPCETARPDTRQPG